MTSERVVAHHSKSQSEVETASFVDRPAAKRDHHEECPNLSLVWNFLLQRSSQLAGRSRRDCQQRADWYVSQAHHRLWAKRTSRCLSRGLVGWA